jgi:hypothetical protein
MESGRARGHHYTVETMFLDVGLDLLLSGLRAGVERVLGEDHVGEVPSILRDFFTSHRATDVLAAMTDVNAYFCIVRM